MAKKKDRARTERRRRERAAKKDVRAREKLNALSPGGSPGLAIEVSTPSVIEPMLRSIRCHQCDGELEPAEMTAPSTESGPRRLAQTRCKRCHTRRDIWFAVGPTLN